ncbi:MAG TPA: DUF6659 family protein [Nitrosopumilaceae archaeon]|nr:DUF6659 family protein [Nitrosopumilaceae archaeon]
MNYDKLCKDVLETDKAVRFAGIYGKNGELLASAMRENTEALLTPDEVKMSLYHAKLRWDTRKALAHRLGKEKYSMTEYEKIKRVSIPVEENQLLLVSMETNVDHARTIDRICNLISEQ